MPPRAARESHNCLPPLDVLEGGRVQDITIAADIHVHDTLDITAHITPAHHPPFHTLPHFLHLKNCVMGSSADLVCISL